MCRRLSRFAFKPFIQLEIDDISVSNFGRFIHDVVRFYGGMTIAVVEQSEVGQCEIFQSQMDVSLIQMCVTSRERLQKAKEKVGK